MTDLGDRLDTLATEATRGVTLLPLDLAAHARRRHHRRVRAGIAAAVCAALAAAGISYWPSGSHHDVRVATAPGTTAPPAAPAASVNNGIWEKLVGPVRQRTAELTTQPVSAAGVATTARAAQEALGSALAENPSTPVYLVVATGHFACSGSCFNIAGHPPQGTVLGLVFDQTSLSITAMSLSTKPVDLSRLGPVHQLDMAPPTPSPPAGAECTSADLNAPHVKAMPSPETVTQTMALQPAPNLQRLSPPDATPKITAAQAWATLTGLDRPTATGKVQLLLGVLYSQTPATIQNYNWPPTSSNPDTNAQPTYTHTLVWALYSQHQPVVGTGGGTLAGPPTGPGHPSTTTATTIPVPACFFESTVSYIDATTGKPLFSETFPPDQ